MKLLYLLLKQVIQAFLASPSMQKNLWKQLVVHQGVDVNNGVVSRKS